MSIEFRLLKGIPLCDLAQAFNRSFSDYMIPLQLSEEQLAKKMKNDGVNLEISAGAFINDELIGFILHGEGKFNGKATAYNGGTGVIPSMRGNQITKRLYEYILPILKDVKLEQSVLEVISSNSGAIKVYESLDFEQTRKLICFKGAVSKETSGLPESFTLNEPDSIGSVNSKDFCDWTPSWQNSWEAIERSGADLKIITVEKNEEPVAYIIYSPITSRISQFAVKNEFRNQGIGTLLFQELYKRTDKDLSIINVDSKAFKSISFLKALGLKASITQYEMLKKF
ncbi:GNAT family N-acetyltransferase [Gramella sp. KN1008]|uniref:GNAT family N-acetyltransferase n=1 Tax=Gramella sp. KN1008 TaxID=2529298 RepID=UPI00103A9E99|nr:GNAT family N-acetyltransferase [Gramella sp. KN1008]TBW25781.1 GNAT family N-acetyltransferase [Gramella sp. KN1008]